MCPMTEPEINVDPIIVAILDRQIPFKFFTDGQISAMLRETRMMQRDGMKMMELSLSMERIDRVIRSTVLNPPDLEWLDDQLIDGNVTLVEVMKSVFDNWKVATTDKPAAAPKVKRGRPKRT